MYNKEVQVKANKKWRELNPEKWNEINRKQQAKHYMNNKEKKIEYICRRYIFKKEVSRMMAILL
jgi:hypothetical protein